jgi:CheY-like chemotaxis protein
VTNDTDAKEFMNMAVLLVEDDPIVRLTLSEFLEAAGLEILEAGDANDALVIITDPTQHITVLVTDLDLGLGDDGLVLAEQARRHLPDLQVVYATGSPEKLTGRSVAAWENVFYKPFNPNSLATTVFALNDIRASRTGSPLSGRVAPPMRSRSSGISTSAG